MRKREDLTKEGSTHSVWRQEEIKADVERGV